MNRLLSILFVLFISLNALAIQIKGIVSDESGHGIANAPIKFVMKKTKFDIKTFENKVVDMKTLTFKTDKKGFFEFTPQVDSYFNVFLIEFQGEGFDYAKYLIPDPEEISSKIKQDSVVVNRTLNIHPDWLKLKIAIAGYDTDSPEYKLLRKYGFPDKADKVQDLGVKWYYFSLAKEFLIKK